MTDARELFATARVARLATVGHDGWPHLVPIVFALDEDTLYSAVDAKPKRTTALRRLANIATNPRVCVLADHYAEDWQQLWWVRADGTARVLDPAEPRAEQGIDLLAERYPQYRDHRPSGPVVAVDITRWTAWASQIVHPPGL